MEMTKYMRLLLAFCLACPASICAQGLAAQDFSPDDTTGLSSMSRYLDEVVVTGTLTARTLKNTPVLTRLISGNDIRESGAVTVLDALENFMPGVNFSPNAMGDNIQIQGLDNKYILILVDGERLVNERTENVNFSRLNTSDVKRIEIINGASSVLYGSNAIGAVINIITKDVDKPFQGLARVRYSSYNSYVADASAGFKVKDFTSKTSLSAKNSDGYSIPSRPDENGLVTRFTLDPYSDYTLSQVFKYRYKDRWNAELKGTYYRNETWFLQKFQTRIDHNYTAGGKLQYFFSPQHALALSLNSDEYKGDQVYKLRNDSTVFVNSSRYTSLRLVDSWDATELIQVVGGGEVNWEETFSYNQFGFDPGWKNASNANLFSQAEFKTESGLEALAGARYTHHSQFGGYFSPKISLMYRSGDFRFRGNISNGYKAPTLKELYMNFPHRIGDDVPFWVIGNEELVPEESWYKAFSAEYIAAKLNVSVIVHHNSIKNKINTEQIWNEVQSRTEMKYRNVEDARITGIDLSWQWTFLKHFQLKGGYSYADAIDQQTRRQLSGNSKHTATLNLVFKQKRLPFVPSSISCPYSLLLSGRAMSPHIFYSEDSSGDIVETSTGSYFISNAVYTQQFPVYKEIRGDLQFGVNNLLNYVNRDALSNNPGRRFFVSLGISF
ncbi:MAG: TonB-dependent receptor [Tannerellaceae bacterium]|jgi:outer membrane receptor for ferrienterochelin and colicins|nr:TonB-dependent receptor [Tannerellaceae bacterium]